MPPSPAAVIPTPRRSRRPDDRGGTLARILAWLGRTTPSGGPDRAGPLERPFPFFGE